MLYLTEYNIPCSSAGVKVAGQRLRLQNTLHYESHLLCIFQNSAMSANYFTACSCSWILFLSSLDVLEF